MLLFRFFDYPPVWLFACMAAASGLAAGAPLLSFGMPLAGLTLGGVEVRVEHLIAAVLALEGLMLMGWAAVTMFRARTTIVPRKDVSALVTDGPFKFSRNPIYLGDVAVLIAWCIATGAASSFVMVPVFIWLITKRFIEPEEAGLRAQFPEVFGDWSARVRRWI